jgi:hypothetical protein
LLRFDSYRERSWTVLDPRRAGAGLFVGLSESARLQNLLRDALA